MHAKNFKTTKVGVAEELGACRYPQVFSQLKELQLHFLELEAGSGHGELLYVSD